MKATIKGSSVEDLQVTFYITNKEEKSIFHDRVAINICQGPHKFIGHCYDPSSKQSEAIDYQIPIKPAYTDKIEPTMPLDLEKQYAERLGRLAQLCDVVCPWLLNLAAVDTYMGIPEEVKTSAEETMDYVDAIRP